MGLAAFPVAFLALEVPVWTLYASLAVIGVEWGLYDPFWIDLHAARGRAGDDLARLAYDYLCVLAFYPAGLALAGPLADAFGALRRAVGRRGAALAVVIALVLRGATCARLTTWGRRRRG